MPIVYSANSSFQRINRPHCSTAASSSLTFNINLFVRGDQYCSVLAWDPE
jgi:hypothetical protein